MTADGRPHHPYSVFASRASGKQAVAVANYSEDKPVTVQVRLDNGQPLARWRLVDDPTWHSTAGGITIPPYGAAIVIA